MPPPTDLDLDVATVTLRLMPERAVFEPESRTLFVADLHLGKAAVFRARGVPVPEGSTQDTLDRLAQALARTAATRLVVLGDLLHARESRGPSTVQALADWRAHHPALTCLVVEGNHDRHAGRLQASLGFDTLPGAYAHAAVRGVHAADEATDDTGTATLAGHVHPVVHLRGRHDRLRLPCYWLRGRVLVLPAFGAFTGGFAVRPSPDDRLFLATDPVRAVTPAASR